MTPRDHNKTLAIIYSLLGGLLAAAAFVELIRVIVLEKELARIRSSTELKLLVGVGLGLTVYILSVAYGLLRRRSWARIPALVLSVLFIWLFPLGTALAIYNWWFLHSEGGKQLYSRPSA